MLYVNYKYIQALPAGVSEKAKTVLKWDACANA